MANTAMVSFKLELDHYAVVKAMATSRGKSISEFVREPPSAPRLVLRPARVPGACVRRNGAGTERSRRPGWPWPIGEWCGAADRGAPAVWRSGCFSARLQS